MLSNPKYGNYLKAKMKYRTVKCKNYPSIQAMAAYMGHGRGVSSLGGTV